MAFFVASPRAHAGVDALCAGNAGFPAPFRTRDVGRADISPGWDKRAKLAGRLFFSSSTFLALFPKHTENCVLDAAWRRASEGHYWVDGQSPLAAL